jgi:flagellar L-ring protein precursor FlgH
MEELTMTAVRNRRTRVLLVAVILLAAAAPATGGEPLIDFETGQTLVSNLKARQVGDLITIIITESASAKATSKTKADAKSETSGGPGLGFLDFIKPWDLDTENKFKGDGDTQRGGSLRAEITARVIEVLPNGDLRLQGTRMVNINGEKQLIEITGICRARDINPDNTIMSTFISEAQIAYNGSGMVNDVSQPGVISKVLNWLF